MMSITLSTPMLNPQPSRDGCPNQYRAYRQSLWREQDSNLHVRSHVSPLRYQLRYLARPVATYLVVGGTKAGNLTLYRSVMSPELPSLGSLNPVMMAGFELCVPTLKAVAHTGKALATINRFGLFGYIIVPRAGVEPASSQD